MTDTDNTETQTPEQLLVELAELHMRTHASPLPKHPAAMGWQATTGSMAAGFARALHALMETNPAKAAEIAEWFDGPFGEGPDSLQHTDWTERHVAKSAKVLEQWSLDAREAATRALEATEDWEKTEQSEPSPLWAAARHSVAWLDRTNGAGRHETAMRLMKLVEEAGEVMQAYIGVEGQNPRKGVTHKPGDVAAELCDVILTAAVALHRFTDDPEALMAQHAAAVVRRIEALGEGS
ncbi:MULTISPECIES: MazG-like family protein [Streptomyces]|uniref:Uncharacterized protein n=1 Tax=Streptomyces mordarskii TaxID=1226758 RepID=A0ABP3NZX8_9ACTN